jgi:hypothetical protein
VEDTQNNQPEQVQDAKNPDRRKILKLMAAGGAVTAVTMLPGKWSSPVVKSGVLPAHAQVTPQQEYEVRCGEWGWERIPDEPAARYEFTGSATAMDVTNNVPLPNVRLNASALIAPLVTADTFGDTDANGLANFTISANVANVLVPLVEITVTFDDPQYGDDECMVVLEPREPN